MRYDFDTEDQVFMQVKKKKADRPEFVEYKRKDPKRDKGWKSDYTVNRNKKRGELE